MSYWRLSFRNIGRWESREISCSLFFLCLRAEIGKRGGGERIRLTTFQTGSINRAFRILDVYNGVLISDGGGPGETFVGGEGLRRVIESNRKRALRSHLQPSEVVLGEDSKMVINFMSRRFPMKNWRIMYGPPPDCKRVEVDEGTVCVNVSGL